MNVSLHLSRCLRNAVRFLTLLCALALAACTQDDDAVGGAPVEVRLAVTADHEETLPVRQTTGEEGGDEHEYMHELCVFIVDETGTIEHRLLPDLSGDADAQTGNLQQWTSYPILLTPGEKTLYAFANWSMAADDEWTQLLSQTEGAAFDVGLLEQGKAQPLQDYVELHLEDQEPVLLAAERLRPYYPQLLLVSSQWACAAATGERAARLQGQDKAAVFSAFFKEVLGEEPQPEDVTLFSQIAKEVSP